MDTNELKELLRELRFSAELTDATAAKLVALVAVRHYLAGAVIFAEGAENPWVYLVVEGEVALEMCIPARGCTRILTLGAGDLLAWSSLLGNGRMTAGAHALTDVRLLAAPAKLLKDLCASDQHFAAEFYREVARALSNRLVATRLQLLDLYGDTSAAAMTALAH
ncbi:MAG TPA: Crp/Fnr family transcriptional regulator [Pirellulaceae bacterium]|nr:Crp/Fnr family transcriptional regulator [Pirellulaceae bacterium]